MTPRGTWRGGVRLRPSKHRRPPAFSTRPGSPAAARCGSEGSVLAAYCLCRASGFAGSRSGWRLRGSSPELLRFLKVYSEPWHQNSRLECCKLPQVPLSRKKVLLGSSRYTQTSALIPDSLKPHLGPRHTKRSYACALPLRPFLDPALWRRGKPPYKWPLLLGLFLFWMSRRRQGGPL